MFDLDQPPLRTIALAIVKHLAQGGRVEGLAAYCDGQSLHGAVQRAIESAVRVGATRGEAWLLLAHWTDNRGKGLESAAVTATLLLHIDDLDEGMRNSCLKIFDETLGNYELDGWRVSRAQRLRRALSWAKP